MSAGHPCFKELINMAFHFRQNSMFHFTLYFAKSILATVQWNVHFFASNICPLSFCFPHPTLGIVLASFCIRHSTFRIELLPVGQQPMEIVGSIDLTHPRSNGGRESVERPPSGVDSGDLLHSRQLDVDRRVHDQVIKAADR